MQENIDLDLGKAKSSDKKLNINKKLKDEVKLLRQIVIKVEDLNDKLLDKYAKAQIEIEKKDKFINELISKLVKQNEQK
ncbi:hypothetical protein [uncultured Clostridium sp.]|uniref:hypothetical protein n=1 Tax=uncultured Clostridium sp. TaxID=59620 RepID=UPI002639CAF2|nr:hypothetical protein [uncultured Clostridium sp.]